MRVAVIMGSTSDLPKVEPAIDLLKTYGVAVDVRCLSAHRAHAGLSAFIEEANNNGTEVIIAAAGMAAALPGVVASQSSSGYRSTYLGFKSRGYGCTFIHSSDAAGDTGCNSCHKRQQECGIPCTSDYGKQA